METGVYVDVLLAVNYIVNLILIGCSAKIAGRKPRGRRIVAAALFGSVCSLTIFLPFQGFWESVLLKLAVSAGIVLLAFRWLTARTFLKEWLLFFTVTFCFAGVMLGVWMTFRPKGMVYYNGAVYFDISTSTLLITTIGAYGILEIAWRIARSGRIGGDIWDVRIELGGRSVQIRGLVDTGNALYEPFSGFPVAVCALERIAALLPQETVAALSRGDFARGRDCGLPLRGVPYSGVGHGGLLPAFRPDRIVLSRAGQKVAVANAYVAVSGKPLGDERYDAVLSPAMSGTEVPAFRGQT